MGIRISGLGYRLGSRCVTNDDVSSWCGLPAIEVLEKTGIQTRWYAAAGECLLDLAAGAVSDSLEGSPDPELDFVWCATFAHDLVYPSLASRIDSALGLNASQLMDVQSNCTGFLNALLIGHDRLLHGAPRERGVVLAAESNSPFIDRSSAESVMFWSDGAGAVLLERNFGEPGGILARASFADTTSNQAVRLEWEDQVGGGRATTPVVMNGIPTWRQATAGIPRVVTECLVSGGLDLVDVDWFIFHQANVRLVEYLTAKMRIPQDRVLSNASTVGNLGAGSIPVILAQAAEQDVFSPGDRVLMAAIGAGYTFVALVWEW
jgi:3-oxoacyl-[acyl-carrier-protein] synthase-3